jgi:G3E family GTPase
VEVDLVAGYLGAGKTTCILGLIEADPEPQRLAVLVNEFGEIGIDGMLMAGTTDVVELSSGCICCTLRLDFRQQIIEIAERFAPRRLLVEPTGVATVAQVLRALAHPALQPHVSGTRVIVVVDAVSFTERLRESPGFFGQQVTQADVILLNKTDLVSPARVAAVRAGLESMSPDAWIIPTVRGQIDGLDTLPPPKATRDPGEADVIAGLDSRSFDVAGVPPVEGLRALFHDLAAGRYGTVERAKGVIETAEGWVRLDVASGLVHEEPWAPAPASRVAVIGRDLDKEALQEAFTELSLTKGGPWNATA